MRSIIDKMLTHSPVVLLAVILAGSAEAQTKPYRMQIPVICGPVEQMTDPVMSNKGEYKEQPYIGWAVQDGLFGVITLNHETKTSTIFLIKEDQACILTSGTDTKIYEPRKGVTPFLQNPQERGTGEHDKK